MPRFDLNLLTPLDALLTEVNVTRAAERLNVTQPTMSGILERLRYHFDDPILVRVGRQMELTNLAETLIEPVHEALLNVNSLMSLEINFEPKTSTRTFKIMASDYCTLILMPKLIKRLPLCAPNVRIEILPLYSPIERLMSGSLDLCICPDDISLLDGGRNNEIMRSNLLFSDEFVCIVAQDHPLNEGATLEEYMQFPHIEVNFNGLRSIETESMKHYFENYKPKFTVSDFSLVPELVCSSNCTGIIQKHLAKIAERTLGIKAFTPPFKIANLHETMLWHPRNIDEPAHIWLRGIVMEEMLGYE